MDEREREGLKEQLSAMAAGRGDGIDLDTPTRWSIEHVRDAAVFFRHLQTLIPGEFNLYFEGTELEAKMVSFYEAHRASNAESVVRDMIFPVPDIHHLRADAGVLNELSELVTKYPLEKCFFHVKAYRDGKLLFAFHDAFDGSDLLVADSVLEERVRDFTSAVGATYKREENLNKRDPKQLERFLWALENPEKVKFRTEDGKSRALPDRRPWWKRILMFWK